MYKNNYYEPHGVNTEYKTDVQGIFGKSTSTILRGALLVQFYIEYYLKVLMRGFGVPSFIRGR